jgi:hypothetical protein
MNFKGTVAHDFSPPVFFIKRLPQVPIDTPRKDFDYFYIHRVIRLLRCFTGVNSTSKASGVIVIR